MKIRPGLKLSPKEFVSKGWRRPRVWDVYFAVVVGDDVVVFLPHYCTINLAPSVSESSPKGIDSELSGKTSGRKRSESRMRVLIG